jgi:hypothetical protein
MDVISRPPPTCTMGSESPKKSRMYDPTNIDTTRMKNTLTAIRPASALRMSVEHPAVLARKIGTLAGGLMMDASAADTSVSSSNARTSWIMR